MAGADCPVRCPIAIVRVCIIYFYGDTSFAPFPRFWILESLVALMGKAELFRAEVCQQFMQHPKLQANCDILVDLDI